MKKFNSKNKKIFLERGFTLIEMMTAVTLFMVIMTISMGSILSLFDASRKSESLKTVMDNLNFTVESMSREIRFGKNYHCEASAGADLPYTAPKNCLSAGNELVSFLSADGVQIVYQKNGPRIEKSVDGGQTYLAVTAPEIIIESVSFYVVGATLDSKQPKVIIKIRGSAGIKEKANTISDFTVQTMVSQRQLDNG